MASSPRNLSIQRRNKPGEILFSGELRLCGREPVTVELGFYAGEAYCSKCYPAIGRRTFFEMLSCILNGTGLIYDPSECVVKQKTEIFHFFINFLNTNFS